jgi:threonine dehydrogenase-like Zn-dependent dehydrogenase
MKAVVFHDVGDIRLEDVDVPVLQDSHDAIVRLTVSGICGTDLHMIRGTLGPMVEGTILGHEGVGVVEQVGKDVRNFRIGDRVVIASTIACGYCSYCRAGYYSQCDNSNPNGSKAGTCFFGGPKSSGPIDGLQAEKARVPFANIGMVKINDAISDEDALVLSDILPTGYFGADIARIKPGSTVAVFGCGPVGLCAIKSAFLMGASQIIVVDCVNERLDMAQKFGAEIVNFDYDEPVEAIMELTGGIGVDRVIDAVGVDAMHPHYGPQAHRDMEEFDQELRQVAPRTNPKGDNWHPGDGPGQVMQWGLKAIAKAGTMSVIGVYPETVKFFPFGEAMNKNIKVNMGNCNHRKYIPLLMDLILQNEIRPKELVTNYESFSNAIEAYEAFDQRKQGWVKVELLSSGKPS